MSPDAPSDYDSYIEETLNMFGLSAPSVFTQQELTQQQPLFASSPPMLQREDLTQDNKSISPPAVDILSSHEVFEQWLAFLAQCYAFTDIYFSPDGVRLGVGGQVQPLDPPLPWNASASRRLLKWLGKNDSHPESKNRLEQSLERYGSSDTSWNCGRLRFRVNIFYTQQQIGFVFRRIPEAVGDFSRLSLPVPVMTRLAASLETGLFLISGRAGSGKSATLSAFVQFWNQHRHQHILIIEDPVEYFYRSHRSLIHQREVGVDVPSFADALRGALRQSPHIIVVGEIRDEETARMTLQAAETGHLVAATIHAGDTFGALQRFTGFFPENEQKRAWGRLVSVFNVVLGQWLLPLKSAEKKSITSQISRVPAIETLRSTYHVRQLLISPHTGREVVQQAMENGRDECMITLDDYLYLLVKTESISNETALSVAYSPNNLKLRLQMETKFS